MPLEFLDNHFQKFIPTEKKSRQKYCDDYIFRVLTQEWMYKRFKSSILFKFLFFYPRLLWCRLNITANYIRSVNHKKAPYLALLCFRLLGKTDK